MSDIQALYQLYLANPTISTDTRNISNDCLFFALKGDHFNANTFAEKALENGAAYAVIDEEAYKVDERCILVDDVLTTLQELAKHHRKQLKIPVIGLTGSNGKTTTKELIKAVLAQKYSVFATHGNLNNHIGVPLSVLSISLDTQIAVIEMGANHQQEIAFLCTIAQPTHGLITNVGMAHLDGFGGFEGVKKGKSELYTYIKSTGGTAFINRNNHHLMEMSTSANLRKVIYYGTNKEDDLYGELVKADPYVSFNWSAGQYTYLTQVNLTGAYNFENSLAAVCIGVYFDVSPLRIIKGLTEYYPNNNRSQLTKTERNTLICDFYNANPSSMSAAINNLGALVAANKTAILGDMFELGEEASAQHELIIQIAATAEIDQLIFIGTNFYAYKDRYAGLFFNTAIEAAVFVKTMPLNDHLILLKGSRGMALEQLMPLL
ncbi:UDP-N-acetylmuramoyl-tripeptide--D-alanyl-D-alanine ligase [Pedobacter sp.]|uniref:UDP-N-acetylmuramoyl-tripeptide--D-alanyl-D- alanine ligase n=1 Tax=Pedobacter sp. TaxID=1411316 RepID=UPI003D7FE034